MNCRSCKYYRIGSQECTNEDFVRESLVDVSEGGGFMIDEMMGEGICNTFGTPPNHLCNYYEFGNWDY